MHSLVLKSSTQINLRRLCLQFQIPLATLYKRSPRRTQHAPSISLFLPSKKGARPWQRQVTLGQRRLRFGTEAPGHAGLLFQCVLVAIVLHP